MKTLEKLILTVCAACIACSVLFASTAFGSPTRGRLDVYPLSSPLLNNVALNGAASTRSFVVETRGYKKMLLHAEYTHSQTGTITFLPESADDSSGTTIYTMTTCSTAAGACTLNYVTGTTTPSLSGDKDFAIRLDVSNYVYVKITVTHNNSPDANDKLTIYGWLLAG